MSFSWAPPWWPWPGPISRVTRTPACGGSPITIGFAPLAFPSLCSSGSTMAHGDLLLCRAPGRACMALELLLGASAGLGELPGGASAAVHEPHSLPTRPARVQFGYARFVADTGGHSLRLDRCREPVDARRADVWHRRLGRGATGGTFPQSPRRHVAPRCTSVRACRWGRSSDRPRPGTGGGHPADVAVARAVRAFISQRSHRISRRPLTVPL